MMRRKALDALRSVPGASGAVCFAWRRWRGGLGGLRRRGDYHGGGCLRLAWVLLVLLVPLAAAEQATQRTHVHDQYAIPYNVQLGGVGGGLFQGQTIIYVTYDPVLPDSDEADENGVVSGLVTVAAFGPGSNIVAATASSSVVINNGCGTASSVSSDSGVATTRSHHTQTWRVEFNNGAGDVDKCELVLRVSNTGATAYVLDVPVVFFNDDVQPTSFQQTTGLNGLEFLAFLAVIALTVLFWSRSKDEIVQVFCGVLLFFTAAISISLTNVWPAWMGFGAVLGVFGGYMIARSALEWFSEA